LNSERPPPLIPPHKGKGNPFCICISTADLPSVLALNNAHATELSLLSRAELGQLLSQAFYAKRIGALDAFLIAFDQDADYASPNFLWHRQRTRKFVYVDRIVVAPHARGRGLARALYEDVFRHAARAGHGRICCEVNADPPNPASDAFHAALGFVAVGLEQLKPGKSVRYFTCMLPAQGTGLNVRQTGAAE
jgi:uncharacterized protein